MEDTGYYKKVLGEEKEKLETELDRLGKRDPKDPNSWDVSAPNVDVMRADENEVADRAEELHIDSIVLDELEIRHKNVARALQKIARNSFGACEVCNEPIENERLRANPAARTCKTHMGSEDSLEK